ncbi:hypothetical protein [Fusobacterium sp. PH5-44]|uniref:hypothetical protein n=1 Tax=unclassified Fusobacterium TaxID=2648384 RepID=UPI003D1C3628
MNLHTFQLKKYKLEYKNKNINFISTDVTDFGHYFSAESNNHLYMNKRAIKFITVAVEYLSNASNTIIYIPKTTEEKRVNWISDKFESCPIFLANLGLSLSNKELKNLTKQLKYKSSQEIALQEIIVKDEKLFEYDYMKMHYRESKNILYLSIKTGVLSLSGSNTLFSNLLKLFLGEFYNMPDDLASLPHLHLDNFIGTKDFYEEFYVSCYGK